MAGGGADFILVLRAMYIDEAIARIRILIVQSVQPQNARRYQVLRLQERLVTLKRNTAYKDGSVRRIASDLLRHAETSGRRFEAPLLRPDAESRRRHRVSADFPFVLFHGQLLISNRNVNALHSNFSDSDKFCYSVKIER